MTFDLNFFFFFFFVLQVRFSRDIATIDYSPEQLILLEFSVSGAAVPRYINAVGNHSPVNYYSVKKSPIYIYIQKYIYIYISIFTYNNNNNIFIRIRKKKKKTPLFWLLTCSSIKCVKERRKWDF